MTNIGEFTKIDPKIGFHTHRIYNIDNNIYIFGVYYKSTEIGICHHHID